MEVRRRVVRADALAATGWIAGSLGALCGLLGPVLAGGLDPTSLVGIASGSGACVFAAIIIDRQPSNRAGWGLLAGGIALVVFSLFYSYAAGQVRDGVLTNRVGTVAAVAEIIGVFAGASLPLFQFLFPDGQLPSPRWRPVFAAYLIGWFACPIAVAVAIWPHRAPGIVADNGPVDIGVPADLGTTLTVIGLCEAFAALSMAAGIAAIAVRLRQPRVRRQVLLALWGVGLTAVLIAATAALSGSGTAETVTSLCAPLPLLVCVTIAMRRHDLFDVERLVGRTITYATLTVLLVGLYAGITVGLGALLPRASAGSSVLVAAGTLAVAAAFRPLLRLVRAAVDRRFDRRTWIATRTIETFTSDLRGGKAAAAEIAAVLFRALGDPTGTIVYLDGDQPVDASGRATILGDLASGRIRREVLASGTTVAMVELDGRFEDEPRLLDAVLSSASLAIENAALHAQAAVRLAEVEASRSRIVDADDSNWRRIERDLHDGAQQRLVALALRLRIAERESPDRATAAVLADAVSELRGTVSELRDLTRSVLPPVLADEGLAVALGTTAGRLPIPVTLHVIPDRLPPMLEATAWFVASEGMTNAAKHSGATAIRIDVRRTGDAILLTVADDGTGGAVQTPGGGLQGLADRVAAAGGRFAVHSERGEGTTLEAVLPCTS